MPTTFIPLDYLHEMSHETSHMGKKIKIVPQKTITYIQNICKVNAHFVNNNRDN